MHLPSHPLQGRARIGTLFIGQLQHIGHAEPDASWGRYGIPSLAVGASRACRAVRSFDSEGHYEAGNLQIVCQFVNF
jgi:hypothetical protein